MLYNSADFRPKFRSVDEESVLDALSGEERGVDRMQSLGRHLLLELYDCSSEILSDVDAVRAAMVEAAKRAEATIIDVVFHEFNPFGISGVVVIAESHLSIHTWPEHRYAAVDIFTCGDTVNPDEAAEYLVGRFGASRSSLVEVRRGLVPGASVPLPKPAKEGVISHGSAESLQVVL